MFGQNIWCSEPQLRLLTSCFAATMLTCTTAWLWMCCRPPPSPPPPPPGENVCAVELRRESLQGPLMVQDAPHMPVLLHGRVPSHMRFCSRHECSSLPPWLIRGCCCWCSCCSPTDLRQTFPEGVYLNCTPNPVFVGQNETCVGGFSLDQYLQLDTTCCFKTVGECHSV